MHVAAALDHRGALLGEESFDTTAAGYRRLLGWLRAFGDVELIGDRLHDIRLRTVAEELGGARRFTRVRCTVRPSRRFGGIVALLGLWTALAPFAAQRWPPVAAGAGWLSQDFLPHLQEQLRQASCRQR